MTSDDHDTPTESDDPGDAPPELRSFGRRRGRKLSPRQDRLLRELLPQIHVDLASRPLSGEALRTGAADVPMPRLDFREVWLEIGFGGGEHLLWQAEHNPDVVMIGAEPFEDGVVKVLAAIEDRRLGNIRLHADDARPLLRWLPGASIDRAFVLFPDPWPKTRHRKRRLINPSTLVQLVRVLRPGAELRIGTDIGDYSRTIMMAFQQVPGFRWLAEGPADWRVRPDDWPPTRYEQKAHREGRKCAYLRFERSP